MLFWKTNIKKEDNFWKGVTICYIKKKELETKIRVLLKKALIARILLSVGKGKNNFEYRKRSIGRKSLKKGRDVFERKCGRKSLLQNEKLKGKSDTKKGWSPGSFSLNMIRLVGFLLSYHTLKFSNWVFWLLICSWARRFTRTCCWLFFLIFGLSGGSGHVAGRQCSGSGTVCHVKGSLNGIEFSTSMQSGCFTFCNWFFYSGIGLLDVMLAFCFL